jgi:hypothetical protein
VRRTLVLLALLLLALSLLAVGATLVLGQTTAGYVHEEPEFDIDLEATCDSPVELLVGRHDTATPGPFVPAEGGRVCKRAAWRNLAVGTAFVGGAVLAFRTRWRLLRHA